MNISSLVFLNVRMLSLMTGSMALAEYTALWSASQGCYRACSGVSLLRTSGSSRASMNCLDSFDF